jgi:hypothetical protein
LNKDLELIETSHSILPTNMARRKKIVLKPRYDLTIIPLIAEKLKEEVFPRKRFHKPKPSEVKLSSVKKYYEQYLIIKGKYSLDHCKSLIYNLEVEKDAQKVFLLNETIKPETNTVTDSDECGLIKLSGVASFHYEDETCCVIDNKGQEINSQKLDNILNKKLNKEILTKSGLRKELSKVQISTEEEINLVRTKLVKRPPNVGEVIKEMFEINERKIFYIPMFELNFENTKTGKEAVIKINGVTGKIILSQCINKTIPYKIIEDLKRQSLKIIKPESPNSMEVTSKSTSSKVFEPIDSKSIKETLKSRSDKKKKEKLKPKKVLPSLFPISETSKVKIDEETLEFPAKVVGDIFYVGDKVTAIVGDLEIPYGTTVYDTLVVKGNLKIGKNCKMLGTIKALGNIVIGDNTIIKGNVISYRNVSVGPGVKIHGELIIKKALHSQYSTTPGSTNE